MKLALLAAAALFATPALAQTSGGTGSATPVGPDAKAASQTGQSSMDTAEMPATQTPATDPAMTQQAPMQNMSAPTTGGMESAGGYQPAAPAMSGPMTPGVQPVFRPAPSPAQAYPAPAPLASYPICKKGQYDDCMQRGGR